MVAPGRGGLVRAASALRARCSAAGGLALDRAGELVPGAPADGAAQRAAAERVVNEIDGGMARGRTQRSAIGELCGERWRCASLKASIAARARKCSAKRPRKGPSGWKARTESSSFGASCQQDLAAARRRAGREPHRGASLPCSQLPLGAPAPGGAFCEVITWRQNWSRGPKRMA